MTFTEAASKILPRSRRVRTAVLAVLDILIVMISGLLAILFRFDFSIGPYEYIYFKNYMILMPVTAAITVAVYFFGKIYRIMWSRASIQEACRIAGLNIIIMLMVLGICTLCRVPLPRSFYPLLCVFQTAFEWVLRYSYRMGRIFAGEAGAMKPVGARTMIFGAGDAGFQLGHEMQTSGKVSGALICYMDDNKFVKNKLLNGVPVLGGREDIERVCREENIEQIFIAVPAASPKERKEILDHCRKTQCHIKTLPGVYQLINGEVSVSKLRPVQIEDLLGREQVNVNTAEIAEYVRGKTVLITGGGGSIGSELCRQIANHKPKQLIIFDIYENNAYDIQQELWHTHPELDLVALIGSVRNTERINQVMRDYRPDIVYHAAAHKHVPLMEGSPKEAIKNNVFGTYKTAEAAARYGVKRFVMISTDKAVNPTNIMGASKRMCEMVIQIMDRKYPDTDFVAVRFGNVLGSSGSVIPLFKKQIENGGPVTVTDPKIIRYFMTIPEAVSLVLQAGAYAKGGEIFVLDMGEPVKILDLAENLIRLSGYKPYEEIPIEFTGLRPGEKLYEEMLMNEEGLQDTPNHMIHIGKPIDFDHELYRKQLEELYPIACSDDSDDEIKRRVSEIVTTYKPQYNGVKATAAGTAGDTEYSFSLHEKYGE